MIMSADNRENQPGGEPVHSATLDDLAEPYRLYVGLLEEIAAAAGSLTVIVDEKEIMAVKLSMGKITEGQYRAHGRAMELRVKRARNLLRVLLKKLEDGLDESDTEDPEVVRDLLVLANVFVEKEGISKWTKEQRNEASTWAAATHMKATGQKVKVPDRPEFLPEPV